MKNKHPRKNSLKKYVSSCGWLCISGVVDSSFVETHKWSASMVFSSFSGVYRDGQFQHNRGQASSVQTPAENPALFLADGPISALC